ncbi:hypothetical protein EV360DRAFT_74106 [Lentinula raphanica]|nr:hypothetical protein EV360DRAFT_74106 [Lentinula raphanica]
MMSTQVLSDRHFNEKFEVTLAPYRPPRWRRWMKVFASLASVIGSFGSAIAAYKNSANLSLAFAVVAAIVSAMQLVLSPDMRNLLDPEAYPLPSSFVTDTAASSVSASTLSSDASAAPSPVASSSPSSRTPSGSPVMNQEDEGKEVVQHRDQMVQTNDEDLFADGENITTELPTLFDVETKESPDDLGSTITENDPKRSEESALTTGIATPHQGVGEAASENVEIPVYKSNSKKGRLCVLHWPKRNTMYKPTRGEKRVQGNESDQDV